MGGSQSKSLPPQQTTRISDAQIAEAAIAIDRAGQEIHRLRRSEERYKAVATEALAEAQSSRKEAEALLERQMWGLGAIGVLSVGAVAAAGLAVAARRSKGAALEAAQLSLTEARRRAALDVENATKFGVSKLAKDLLDVADNLSRAAASVPEELRSSADQPALKALYDGVVMTDAVLLKTFESHGTPAPRAPLPPRALAATRRHPDLATSTLLPCPSPLALRPLALHALSALGTRAQEDRATRRQVRPQLP